MRSFFSFRKGLTHVGLVGMLVLMCAVVVRAQAPLVVPSGTTTTLSGSAAYSTITVEPGATLNIVGVGTVLKVNYIDVQLQGKCSVKDAWIDMIGNTKRIDVASGNNPNEGAFLEMTNAVVTSSSSGWDGIYVAGLGNSSTNLQQNKTVGQAKLDGCKIEKSSNGICNYKQGNNAFGGGIIQVRNCSFVVNGTSLDFRNGLYTSNPDVDSSYVILSSFSDIGLFQGNFTTNPARAINAYRVNGLRILGNSFKYSGVLPNSLPVCGIIYDEAGIQVEDHCSGSGVSTSNPCIGGTLTPSSFENLTYGVLRSGTNPNKWDVTISRNKFINCRTGVYAAYTDSVKVTENSITLKQPGSGFRQTGIELAQCADFQLYANTINTLNANSNSNTYGIVVRI